MAFVRPLHELRLADTQACGGKAASLGELVRMGVAVPAGVSIAAGAFPYALAANGLDDAVRSIARRLRSGDPTSLESGTAEIRELICSLEIPVDLRSEIEVGCRPFTDAGQHVCVRSSVAIEDSDISSFPGLMDTYHYVCGLERILARLRECWASVWNTSAALARQRKGIAHERALIAPIVQQMVHADSAGVLFTSNPVTAANDEIVIEANWGIGESVVSGIVTPDQYVLDRDTLTVKRSTIADKRLMVTLDRTAGHGRTLQSVPPLLARRGTLTTAQLSDLARSAIDIAARFGFEVDLEWAFADEQLYVLQARRMV